MEQTFKRLRNDDQSTCDNAQYVNVVAIKALFVLTALWFGTILFVVAIYPLSSSFQSAAGSGGAVQLLDAVVNESSSPDECWRVQEEERFDCCPERSCSVEQCEKRGCCWLDSIDERRAMKTRRIVESPVYQTSLVHGRLNFFPEILKRVH